MIYIIQNVFNISDKRFLELSIHFPTSDSHMIFIILFLHPEQWLSDLASSLFSGPFEELSNFFSWNRVIFAWLQISRVSWQSENFLPLCNLPPNSFPIPQKFYPEADTIYSSMLIQEDFPYPCQKASLCQMEFLRGVLSKSCLPTRGTAKEQSGQPH